MQPKDFYRKIYLGNVATTISGRLKFLSGDYLRKIDLKCYQECPHCRDLTYY